MAIYSLVVLTSITHPKIPFNTLILPVTPSVITVNQPQEVRKDMIINVGEATDIGIKKPKFISFSSFFTQHSDTYTNPYRTLVSPEVWLEYFDYLREIIFFIGIAGLRISGRYILADFVYKQVGGVGDDIEYTVKFTRYVPVGIRNVNVLNEAAIEVSNIRNPSSARSAEQSYIVKSFDTWSSIARNFTLNPQRLREYNNSINVFELIVGATIYIPPIVSGRIIDRSILSSS